VKRKFPLFAVVCLCAAALVAGCGGDDEETSAGGSAKLDVVKVGLPPIVDVAPLYVGVEEGFFEAEGLDVKPTLAQSGAALLPSVLSGDFHIGFGNTVTQILASSKNLPLQIISSGSVGGTTPEEEVDPVLVKKDSPIKTPADLAGKKIAVSALDGIDSVTTSNALKKHGVDPSKIRYVEVPYPDMVPAVEAGRVDAARANEPFATTGRDLGQRTILTPFIDTAEHLTIANYFSTTKFINENPDIMKRFLKALDKSLTFSQENPDVVREVVGTYTALDQKVVKKMVLPTFKPGLDVAKVDLLAGLMHEFGVTEEKPDISKLTKPVDRGE
jgi:NitT/TauT family transport system substrate-binding protein